MRKTSLSDNGAYPQFCYLASKNDDLFANFKNNPIYNQILEHVDAEFGKECLDIILKNQKLNFSPDTWKVLLQNDSVGNPKLATYTFGNLRITCSPSTLRYIKVFSDIVSFFDTSNFYSVTEVGIGYAGQCRIFMSLLNINEYNLVDLPEVLALAERFLNEVPPPKRGGALRFFDGTHLYNPIPCDFFISNYAFSELNKSVQDSYLENIILHSKAGYIAWNGDLMHKVFHFDGYSLNQILSIIPNSFTVPANACRIFLFLAEKALVEKWSKRPKYKRRLLIWLTEI